jgi:hypothetical protein
VVILRVKNQFSMFLGKKVENRHNLHITVVIAEVMTSGKFPRLAAQNYKQERTASTR